MNRRTKILFTLTMLLLSSALLSIQVNWLHQYGDQVNNQVLWESTLDQNGNLYAVGYFVNTLPLGNQILTTHGDHDLYLAKFNSQGEPIWAVSAGGTDLDKATGVAIGQDGNIYITGYVMSPTIAFSDSVFTMHSQGDIYIAKFTPDGQRIWFKHFGATPQNESDYFVGFSNSITIDHNNNILIAGGYYKKMVIEDVTLTPEFYGNGFAVKFNQNGSLLWAKQTNASYYGRGYGIAVDSQNNVYLGGDFNGILNFENQNYTGSNDFESAYLVKYDSQGNYQWSKAFIGDDQNICKKLKIDNSDHVIMAGNYFHQVTIEGQNFETQQPGYDSYVAKFNSQGNLSWIKTLTGDGFQDIYDIDTDNNNNVYACGYCHGMINLSPFSVIGRATNAWMAKINAEGTPQSVDLIGSLDIVVANTINHYLDGMIVGGQFNDSTYFGATTLNGFFDFFLMNFSSNGNFAQVSGHVRDQQTNTALGNASVKFGECQFLTDNQGYYSGLIPSGSYQVICRHSGYDPAQSEVLYFEGGSNTVYDIGMNQFTTFLAPPASFIASTNGYSTINMQWEAPVPNPNELAYDNWHSDNYGSLPIMSYTHRMVSVGYTVNQTSTLSAIKLLLSSPYSQTQNIKFHIIGANGVFPDKNQVLMPPVEYTIDTQFEPFWLTLPVNFTAQAFQTFFIVCELDD
ncbi:MAG: hypothetical protein KA886_03540 [Candidatus Cloacimonetes bacterium]|nr:hypothetical protein [Candidatus Cloacimonadota bacterium]